MQTSWLIIDGYNLLHRIPEFAELRQTDLVLARQRLLRRVEPVADRLADKTTLVFDGRQRDAGEDLSSAFVEVLYSPGHLTADTLIERMVHRAPRPQELLVVTSDYSEVETVSAAGAQTMSCTQFLDEAKPPPAPRTSGGKAEKDAGPTLGDFFPG